jgi:hypothetical protein
LTVLDFTTLDLAGESFTLNGRGNGSDQIIIRVSDAFEFMGSDLKTTNLSVDNVIWYYSGKDQFDLHKSDGGKGGKGGKGGTTGGNFMKFSGTIIASNPDAQIRMGEVDFTGRVFGSDLKLGSGFAFQGAVPEPSSSLMLLVGAGSLLLVRRRKA